MTWQYNPFVWLPVLVAALAVWQALCAWRYRLLRGGRAYWGLMVFGAAWALIYALQLSSANAEAAYLWLRLGMVAASAQPPLWLLITLHYTGHEHWITRGRGLAVYAIPIASALLLLFAPAWPLVAQRIWMTHTTGFGVIHVTPGPWFWLQMAYSYLLIGLVSALLARHMRQLPPTYRRQPLMLLGVIVGMLVLNLLNIGGLLPFVPINLANLFSALGFILFTWSIYRYRVLNVRPIARERIIEGMADGMLVLDADGTIADLNPAAGWILAVTPEQAMARPASRVLTACPQVLAVCCHDGALRHDHCRQDLALEVAGATRHYDVHATPLGALQGEAMGRLVLLRDVTERHRAEIEREALIAELQDTLSQVRTLSGLLPICAWCKKIRTDEGYWQQLEEYLALHSEAEFTHGICPDCVARMDGEPPPDLPRARQRPTSERP
jgi:PAS domain S-box-containing protein